MKPIVIENSGLPVTKRLTSKQRERLFYSGMAVAVLVTVFAGFAPSYYLKPYFGGPPLMPLLHMHGLIFSSWIILFVTQTGLVAANRTRVHRRLGIAGAFIAVLMMIVGSVTAIIRAKQGAAPPGIPPLAFLTVPLFDMVVFPSLAGAGFYFRRQVDVHKRLMLLATIAILPAAIARLPFAFIQQTGPLAFFGLADLFLVPCIVYDITSRGRVHRATMLGGLLIVASQPLRLMIAGTQAWLSFAGWLTHLVG
jgi:hypothetical protein